MGEMGGAGVRLQDARRRVQCAVHSFAVGLRPLSVAELDYPAQESVASRAVSSSAARAACTGYCHASTAGFAACPWIALPRDRIARLFQPAFFFNEFWHVPLSSPSCGRSIVRFYEWRLLNAELPRFLQASAASV